MIRSKFRNKGTSIASCELPRSNVTYPDNVFLSTSSWKFCGVVSCKKSLKLYLLLFALFILLILTRGKSITLSLLSLDVTPLTRSTSNLKVSIVILTYKKFDGLAKLIPSVLKQNSNIYEIIIVDNGCLPETQSVVKEGFRKKEDRKKLKYIPLCNNPGYAAGNNVGVRHVNKNTEWILFLNDDLILQGETFLQDMVYLGEAKKNAAAIGCKLLTLSGDEIIEAGSIVWNDGSAAGFGRGYKNTDAPEFSYPMPVDYISGACLMVKKSIYTDYGGFQENEFPNYYEDTDLQMHIQHGLSKEVWFQPQAVALHDEHGSFGTDESIALMKKSSDIFYNKWKDHLRSIHMPPPFFSKDKDGKKMTFLKAIDLRARNPDKVNILYIDQNIPNKSQGGGFGRSYDNVAMIADLGHRVTVTSALPVKDGWCDRKCYKDITNLGVELVIDPWESLMESRNGYYDIVIISRPTTFRLTSEKFREFFRKNSFAIIYDCEALWHRRNELMLTAMQEKRIEFPGAMGVHPLVLQEEKKIETALIKMADVVVAVSALEAEHSHQLSPYSDVQTIGHVMNTDKITKTGFSERNGILFLASFNKKMYYNGDAIWYFIEEIYPHIVEESDDKIPLTIAGRNIPDELLSINTTHPITFIESPDSIHDLYEKYRVLIAPHLYGAGIQYKVSEALSLGIPVVVSGFTAESFGFKPGYYEDVCCIGNNEESFKNCVLDVHNDKAKWSSFRDNGIDFIQSTHNREEVTKKWADVIKRSRNALTISKFLDGTMMDGYMHHGLFTTNINHPKEQCPEGEKLYFESYKDVVEAVKLGLFKSAFEHWSTFGKSEQRMYICKEKNKT